MEKNSWQKRQSENLSNSMKLSQLSLAAASMFAKNLWWNVKWDDVLCLGRPQRIHLVEKADLAKCLLA